MKIIVTDGYVENPGDLSWAPLEALGEVTYYDRIGLTDEDETIRRIGDAEIAVINKAPVTRKVIDSCPNLKLITVLATGYNVVDVAYAKEKGILVCNVPTYGTACVGQYAIALLLEICHHIGHHDKTVHEGKWAENIDWCYWDYPLIELEGKTMGIIGFGRIGQAVANIARAFGMKVLVCTRTVRPEYAEDGVEFVDVDTLLVRSDVLSLHCPATPATRGLINAGALAKAKPGMILLNTARGALVDEEAVADALQSGQLAYYGADAFGTEPLPQDSRLRSLPNAILTPHIAWTTKEALQRLMDITTGNLRSFLVGKGENIVNS